LRFDPGVSISFLSSCNPARSAEAYSSPSRSAVRACK
jgi:hypothetical protein